MRAGKLRHLVTIEASATAPDEYGQPIETWLAVVTTRAEVKDMSGRELVAAQAIHAEVKTLVTMRHRDGITPDMRVVHGARVLDIRAALPDTRRRELLLYCEELS